MAYNYYKNIGLGLNVNYTFDNAVLVNESIFNSDKGEAYPFAGTLTGYSINISYDALNFKEQITGGNVSYIGAGDNIPEEQDGMFFLIDEENGCQEKIENITNAMGCMLLHNSSKGYMFQNATSCSFSVLRTNYDDNEENITTIISMLENGTWMIADNYLQNGYMTFTYNLNETCCLPNHDWFFLRYNPASSVSGAYEGISKIRDTSWFWWAYNLANHCLNLGKPYCLGYILYDYTNIHFMTYAMRDWGWFGVDPEHPLGTLFNIWIDDPALPVFSINNSVGSWLVEHIDNTTVSGYLDQEYKNQTKDSPGVISHNVVGYRNITSSPDDKIIIISNRIDGWWGQTPGDSGVGGAIVLGIAKYMNDYNIKPKYNLTFLFTTGEEYGMRGAQHFFDTHLDKNYILWIGTDQLGFDQAGTNLTITYQNKTYTNATLYNIIGAIVNDTNYPAKMNNRYGLDITSEEGVNGTETKVWRNKCDTICFGKDNTSSWNGYHSSGENYVEGDSLKHTDQNDVNATTELFWNITKYFTVNPDAWFTNITYNTIDSPDDGDTLPDTIQANLTIKSILPSDSVMVKVYYNVFDDNQGSMGIYYTSMNYTINSTGITDSFNFTIPDSVAQSNYSFYFKLYNSTGKINDIAGISGNNVNVTSNTSDLYHL